jgi:hypothetical protein
VPPHAPPARGEPGGDFGGQGGAVHAAQ